MTEPCTFFIEQLTMLSSCPWAPIMALAVVLVLLFALLPVVLFRLLSPVVLVLLLALLPVLFRLLSPQPKGRLPPGSFGLPFVGQSLGLLRAMRANAGEEWLAARARKYGPISKLSLFGRRSVFLTGLAAHRFVFTSGALCLQQPSSASRIIGRRNLLELMGDDHKRVRGAVAHFLKPEVLKKYVGMIDHEVKDHLKVNWDGKKTVKVMPLMKSMTFDIMCSLILGLEKGALREVLVKDFSEMLGGLWALPVNLPFTTFNRSLKARRRALGQLTRIIKQKRSSLEEGNLSPNADLITYLLNLGSDGSADALTEEELLDNLIFIMFAGHDTSSILLTFMIRHLATDPVSHELILQEQEAVAESKAAGEALEWSDLSKMRQTWLFAMEILRMVPPIFGNFRMALKDIEYEGYLIPKGWQVLWAASTTHMDGRVFKDPEKFDLARFENPSSIPPYSFVGFGGGQRVCPGIEFAKIETLIMMHYLVTKFNWKLSCKENGFCRDPMPSPVHGLPIELVSRC